jgi:hypothetical protein
VKVAGAASPAHPFRYENDPFRNVLPHWTPAKDKMRWTMGRVGVVASTCALLVLAPRAAWAVDADVESDTAAQFYDVRSPTGETVLSRRRLTSTLALSGYQVVDAPANDPTGPEVLFRARLRYDADYGAESGESDVTNFGHLVPGFTRQQVDLMYGYLEGRRFAKGLIGFKVGRQYVTDVLGWYSFDGGEVRVTTPFFVAAEAYGGLEVRGGMPLSTSRFEADGVWRGDRSGYDASLYPAFQPASIAPVFGAALESTGVTWLHGRLTYRRAMNTGASNTSEFASGLYSPASYSGTRVSTEKIGYSLEATWPKVGDARGGLVYDVYNAKFGSVYANLDAFVCKRLTVGVDYQFYQPTFDADSIWNIFLSEPMNDLGVRSTWTATDRFAVSAGAHARMFTVQTAEEVTGTSPNIYAGNPSYFPSSPLSFDGGGDVSARYKFGEGSLGMRASGNFGAEGDRVGGDVMGERVFDSRYVVEGRLNLWQWQDNLRPDRDAVSFGYVAGVGYRFAQRSQTLFEFQQDTNRLVGSRLRMMLYLTLAVTK